MRMEKVALLNNGEHKTREVYDQPLLVRHGPLRDVTGQVKYGDKTGDKDTTKDTKDDKDETDFD